VSEYVISTDLHAIDREMVFRFLHENAYWSAGLPRELFDRSMESSLCFSAFAGNDGPQVGFARVVSDRATFAWLCDVFVLPEHRGRGVARRLMDAVMAHPDLVLVRNFLLATRDAHALYARYGFAPLAEPARWMAIRRPYRT
jgi:GNAT superfamily N-acetyltransferase